MQTGDLVPVDWHGVPVQVINGPDRSSGFLIQCNHDLVPEAHNETKELFLLENDPGLANLCFLNYIYIYCNRNCLSVSSVMCVLRVSVHVDPLSTHDRPVIDLVDSRRSAIDPR